MKDVLLIGAIHGLIQSVILLRYHKKSNNLFVTLLFIVSAYLLIQYFGPFHEHPKMILASFILVYLYVPVYYVFLLKLANQKTRFWDVCWPFLPSFFYLLFFSNYLFVPNEHILSSSFREFLILDLLAIIFNFFLLVKSGFLIKNGIPIRTKSFGLTLFHMLMMISSGLWLTIIAKQFGMGLTFIDLRIADVYLVMSLLVFALGYFVMIRRELFIDLAPNKSPYAKLKVDLREKDMITRTLNERLEASKDFLNPNCTLGEIAAQLGIEKTKLSYTINQHMETSFTKLLNEHRVKEFIRLADSNQLDIYNIEGVASQAGFKSKSTFYKAFKEILNVTPTEYLKTVTIGG